MNPNISRSAQVLAARRALATEQNSKIINDPFAHLFIDQDALDFARSTDSAVHYVLMRHRFLDDLVANGPSQIEQVLLLGAGLDTKFLRLVADRHRHVVEVDSEDMVSFKKERLLAQNLPVPSALAKTITDMSDLGDALKLCHREKSTIMIAEGFFMYHERDFLPVCIETVLGYFKERPVFGFDMLEPTYHNSAINERLRAAGEIVKNRLLASDCVQTFKQFGMTADVWFPSRLQSHYLGSRWNGQDDKYVCCAFDSNLSWQPANAR